MVSKTRVFLAHASEDKTLVRALYTKLANRGFQPWLDEIDLLPGQNWQIEIPKAIRSSEIFIACLSRRSVSKQGYIQREFRFALNAYAEKPPDSIYLIPLRFDDCEIPDIQLPQLGVSLRSIHWVDYWLPDGFERLVRAIEKDTNSSERTQSTFRTNDSDSSTGVNFRRGRSITGRTGSGVALRKLAGGILGGLGALMLFLSVVDAGVGGLSVGGILIGAICLAVAYALWPRN